MVKGYGIQIGNDCDLAVSNGQLSIGDTIAQNEYILLLSSKGDIKENPLMGAGIAEMVADNDFTTWKRTIRDALKDDGMTVDRLEISTDGQIKSLVAHYG